MSRSRPRPIFHVVSLSYTVTPTGRRVDRGHNVYRDNEAFLVQASGAHLSRRAAQAIVTLLNTGTGRTARRPEAA